ncbi:MAG: glycosyltransferase family 4 protein [Cyanobacteria bacterium REEB65]|nr:glycosyltransferase family 4 protein [Cyanobacteria bacterium REEB65]
MNVALVSTECEGGGIATHTATLSDHLARLGHAVLVLVPDRRPLATESLLTMPGAGDVQVAALPAAPFPFGRRNASLIGAAVPFAMAIRSALRRLQGLVDVVEAPEWEAPALLVDDRVRLVVRLHGNLQGIRRLNHEPMRAQDRLLAGFERHQARKAAVCLASSRFLASASVLDLGLDLAKVRVLPLGIDTDAFCPASRDLARDRWKLPRDARMALFVGRREVRKGLCQLMEAWAQIGHPDAILVVAGSDPCLASDASLREQARALGVPAARLRILGPVAHSALPSLYAAADFVCLPAEGEPFGLATLEAMSCGRPVVACRSGGTPEILADGEQGLLAPFGDIAALVAAIDRLVASDDLCRKLGIAGRARAEACFSAELAAERTIAAYQSAQEGDNAR